LRKLSNHPSDIDRQGTKTTETILKKSSQDFLTFLQVISVKKKSLR
jgi:hypothetical protein